jgi:hypothetical protein
VLKTIGIVHMLLNYDMLYVGGGDAANVVVDLPDNVRLVSNDAGLTGGIRLWDKDVWQVARGERAPDQPGRAHGGGGQPAHRVFFGTEFDAVEALAAYWLRLVSLGRRDGYSSPG